VDSFWAAFVHFIPESKVAIRFHPEISNISGFPDTEKVYEHHLLAARLELDDFGIADPTTFDANLNRAS